MTVWRLITHHSYPTEAYQWYQSNKIIALGWGAIGDLRIPGSICNQKDISTLCKSAYAGITNAGACGHCLWKFWQDMKIGDLVILSAEGQRKAVVEIVSDYFFDTTTPHPDLDYYHRREVTFTDSNPDKLWKQHPLAPGANMHFPLCELV